MPAGPKGEERLKGLVTRALKVIRALTGKALAEDGASLNQFVSTAVAEKVSALRTARYFEERKGRTDWDAFDRIMGRSGGETPRADDRLPEGYQRARK
jgi:hypothetical protein